jgi:chromate transport protein ChrA
LRATNLYGNPAAQDAFSSPGVFALQPTLSKTVILFFNVEKYPPSLQFLLMTLGLSLLAIAMVHQKDWEIFEGLRGRIGRMFIVFGKVPMFYYVLHLYLIHALAILAALLFGKPVQWLFTSGMFGRIPAEYGFDLLFVYLVWVICIALLYAPCYWYMRYKATHQHRWLSYF